MLNGDFGKLYEWSGLSQQKFHPDKFWCLHMINPQTKNCSNSLLNNINFNNKKLPLTIHPPWPKYIGVFMDNRLNFKYHIKKCDKKVRSAGQLSFFFSYILPHFLYVTLYGSSSV